MTSSGALAVAIGEAHRFVGEEASHAGAVDPARLDQNVARLAAMGARVHPQRAADRTRHAAKEGQAVDAGRGGGARHLGVERRRAGDDAKVGRRLDRAERLAAQANHHAANPAVADDEIGAEADDRDRNFAGQALQEIGEVVLVGRRDQNLRRPADAKPREWRERRVGAQTAAQARR